jgi:hypothetical protein
MKERVVGRKYDPLVWLGAKIGRRPRQDTPACPALSQDLPVMPGPKHRTCRAAKVYLEMS